MYNNYMNKTTNTKNVLELKNVTMKFKSFKALDNVSFSIKQGERVALLGANGAGKTTVTEIIAGINKQSSGKISYGFKYDKSPSEKIGMQFQISNYPSGLTVSDMITFAIKLRHINITKKKLQNLLETFQMEDFYTRKAKSLSGGQRQKLNILMSVLHDPELIIFDELSTGLDAFARENIINFADSIIGRKKVSAIFISHHMEEVEKLCDRVIVMDRGRIIEKTSVDSIKSKYNSLDTYIKKVIRESHEENKDDLSQTKTIKVNGKNVKTKNKKALRIKGAKNVIKPKKSKKIKSKKVTKPKKVKTINKKKGGK